MSNWDNFDFNDISNATSAAYYEQLAVKLINRDVKVAYKKKPPSELVQLSTDIIQQVYSYDLHMTPIFIRNVCVSIINDLIRSTDLYSYQRYLPSQICSTVYQMYAIVGMFNYIKNDIDSCNHFNGDILEQTIHDLIYSNKYSYRFDLLGAFMNNRDLSQMLEENKCKTLQELEMGYTAVYIAKTAACHALRRIIQDGLWDKKMFNKYSVDDCINALCSVTLDITREHVEGKWIN